MTETVRVKRLEKKRKKVRRCKVERKRTGGEEERGKVARDVAEALGIAAGAQSGWLGAAAASVSLDLKQRRVFSRPTGAKTAPSRPGTVLIFPVDPWKTERKHTGWACAPAECILMHAHTDWQAVHICSRDNDDNVNTCCCTSGVVMN